MRKNALAGVLILGALAFGAWHLFGNPAAEVAPKRESAGIVTPPGGVVPVAPEPNTRDSNAATSRPSVAPASTSASSAQRVLAESGYFAPITDVGAEAEFRQLKPVEQLLTPTSAEDALWMQKCLYPKRSDVLTPNVASFESIIQNGDPIRDRDRIAYVANALAAHYMLSGDKRWREYTDRSSFLGPFPAMLELLDLKQRFENGQAEIQDVLEALAYAQVLGEPGAVGLFERPPVPIRRTDGLRLAAAVNRAIRVRDELSRKAAARGEEPFLCPARPAAPWDGGP